MSRGKINAARGSFRPPDFCTSAAGIVHIKHLCLTAPLPSLATPHHIPSPAQGSPPGYQRWDCVAAAAESHPCNCWPSGDGNPARSHHAIRQGPRYLGTERVFPLTIRHLQATSSGKQHGRRSAARGCPQAEGELEGPLACSGRQGTGGGRRVMQPQLAAQGQGGRRERCGRATLPLPPLPPLSAMLNLLRCMASTTPAAGPRLPGQHGH
jgi:hypothetical protein